jgi:DNA-binding transcriptional ArsR family regulator
MSRVLAHPPRDQIQLALVLDCLSDPTRLAIVRHLARSEDGSELRCGDFSALSGKSNLAYHFAKLRESGVMQTRSAGTSRLMKLRRDDLEARFPGLLDAVLRAAERDPASLVLSNCDLVAAD